MIYNFLALAFFIIAIAVSLLLYKMRYGEVILRILSVVLLVAKTTQILVQNFMGIVTIPVEISTISYFMVTIIVAFSLKKFYNIASFFGLIAGLGYFLFYTLFGFTLAEEMSALDVVIGSLSHGYLLFTGLYLYRKNNFANSNKLSIWVTMLAIVCWALEFYDVEQRGITFIYYIIKPEFLMVFDNMIYNALLRLVYYSAIVSLFYVGVHLFYKFNQNIQYKRILKEINARKIKKLKN